MAADMRFSEEDARQEELARLTAIYEEYQSQKLSLNMTRGRPADAQLDMVQKYMDQALASHSYLSKDGTDCRNYGGLDGLIELKEIFAEAIDTLPENVLVIGNASLTLMYDVLANARRVGMPSSKQPWSKLDSVKFLCPVPGYDRHFAVTENLSFEMINVPMTTDGPDMDIVEELCAADDSIKGIWCVPKYSNPDGIVYSAEVCERMASMKAADDFLIMWDNAYFAHHLYDEKERQPELPDMLSLCAAAGHPDRVIEFVSSSKITYAGAGISALVANRENRDWFLDTYQYMSIGPDKMQQLYHARFFEITGGIEPVMKQHAAIMRPKFEEVLAVLEEELGGTGLATWIEPLGGYFISVNLLPGMAREVVRLCKDCGVVLTGAGSTFPYKKDPQDSNLRLAPSYPTIDELKVAIHVFCLCVKIAALQN
ncbi:MAG: aminotransferase class I/II-fold pyridoxal phosphate-dependent enzyme [Fastidiosipilaceae bacterium]|jgi:aspartate/methionine/tyrosine aminotransferase